MMNQSNYIIFTPIKYFFEIHHTMSIQIQNTLLDLDPDLVCFRRRRRWSALYHDQLINQLFILRGGLIFISKCTFALVSILTTIYLKIYCYNNRFTQGLIKQIAYKLFGICPKVLVKIQVKLQ